jgi:hypothetical protein
LRLLACQNLEIGGDLGGLVFVRFYPNWLVPFTATA